MAMEPVPVIEQSDFGSWDLKHPDKNYSHVQVWNVGDFSHINIDAYTLEEK